MLEMGVGSIHERSWQVRSTVALTLAILITLCPFLCGAAEFGQGTHRHDVTEGTSHDSSAPDQCPEEGDNCICQGAVQADCVRFVGDAAGFCLVIDLLLPSASQSLAHMTREGSTTGLASWGNAHAVRSFLQN